MDYKQCPHYDEMVSVLSEGKDLEDISFEIDEVRNCPECSKEKDGVCGLWVRIGFVEDMKPQMSISEAKVTIDTLDEQMEKVVFQLLKNIAQQKDDNDDNTE